MYILKTRNFLASYFSLIDNNYTCTKRLQKIIFKILSIKLKTFKINTALILIKEEMNLYLFTLCTNKSNPVNKQQGIQENTPRFTCSSSEINRARSPVGHSSGLKETRGFMHLPSQIDFRVSWKAFIVGSLKTWPETGCLDFLYLVNSTQEEMV